MTTRLGRWFHGSGSGAGSAVSRGTPRRGSWSIASREFASLEINGSFYTQISQATYARWREETPADFRFAQRIDSGAAPARRTG